MSAIDFPR